MSLDWRMIGALGSTGLAIGIASVLGLTSPTTEPVAWSLAAAVWVVAVRRRQPKAQFQHLLTVGLVAGLLAPAVQVAWMGTYLANQPEIAVQYAQLPDDAPVTLFVLFFGLVKGALFGAVVGIIAMLIDHFAPAKAAVAETGHSSSSPR